MLGEVFTVLRNAGKGQVHISLKPKGLQLVRGERCSLPTPAHPSPLQCQGCCTRWSRSARLADQTENGTGVTTGRIHCHLGKLLRPLVLQTPRHEVQGTAGSSRLEPRVSSALQQHMATARHTRRKVVVEMVSHLLVVTCRLRERFVTRCFMQPG